MTAQFDVLAWDVGEKIHGRPASVDKDMFRLTKSLFDEFYRMNEHKTVYDKMDEELWNWDPLE